tara:strand:+ start:3205 stop:3342 length:138 start_codon:yes stop_codon:yes gene_type:complete
MNGMIVNMKEMKCDCGMSAMYDNNNTVSFVDAYRTLSVKCQCGEV